MPTGYTADVVDGKVDDFEQFAKKCARAMGALVMFRDYSTDYIPTIEEVKAQGQIERWKNKISEAIEELYKFDSMTDKELEYEYNKVFIERREAYLRSKEVTERAAERVNAMLDKVRAWEPPSEDHIAFKTFMIDQLESTLHHDGRPPKEEWYAVPDFDEWVKVRRDNLRRNIEYAEEQYTREVKNTTNRVVWYTQLLKSLEDTDV